MEAERSDARMPGAAWLSRLRAAAAAAAVVSALGAGEGSAEARVRQMNLMSFSSNSAARGARASTAGAQRTSEGGWRCGGVSV
jgi:hypothetical protein